MRAPLEEAERAARRLAALIKAEVPEGFGYICWLVSFGAEGVSTYLSTILRADAIRFLEEWIARERALPETSDFVDGTEPLCWCCSARTNLVTLRGPHRSVDVCTACMRQD
jgi:hypothetical protein